MQDNYKTIEHQIRKYSFEFLKVSEIPLIMLENLNEANPQMIENAQKPNLLAAAIIYVFLKKSGLNGRGGITAKDVGAYFDVKAPAISQKAFDVESSLYTDDAFALENENDTYEFIDKDRFKVNELYWEFTESPDSENIKKSIKTLKSIIKKDPDYFDPYISLYEYYLLDEDFENAFETIEKGFERALDLLDDNGRFPDELPWGFIENRHIIRMIFNFGMFVWRGGNKDLALQIFMQLLRTNHNDNVGARYSIVAILEGFGSQEEWEEKFESDNGMGLEYMAVEEWFYKAAEKHRNIIGWWLDLEDDE